MVAQRLAASALALCLPVGMLQTAFAQSIPPEMAASTQTLLAARGGSSSGGGAVDDSDLAVEEDLDIMNDEEAAKLEWSMGAAIGLSLIPGGGVGLLYTEDKAASFIPFLLSAAGYTVGALYMVGMFDTKGSSSCVFTNENEASSKVDFIHCQYANPNYIDTLDPDPNDRANGQPIDNHSVDPNSNDGSPYYLNGEHYKTDSVKAENNQKIGLYILIGTYAATTLLGAIWSSLSVAEHNETVRKNVESTAQAPRPLVAYDGENGLFGLSWSF